MLKFRAMRKTFSDEKLKKVLSKLENFDIQTFCRLQFRQSDSRCLRRRESFFCETPQNLEKSL